MRLVLIAATLGRPASTSANGGSVPGSSVGTQRKVPTCHSMYRFPKPHFGWANEDAGSDRSSSFLRSPVHKDVEGSESVVKW